jgi:AsmA protein
VAWRDEMEGRTLRLVGLDAKTGRIADGASGRLDIATRVEGTKPELNLDVKGEGAYTMHLAKRAFAFEGVDLTVAGDTQGAKGLAATVKGDLGLDPERELVDIAKLVVAASTTDGVDFKAKVPKLRLAPSGATGEAATAELKLARAERTVTAKLALSPLSAKGRQVRFEQLGIDADVKQGGADLAIKLASPVAIDFDAKVAEIPSLAGDIVASGPQIAQKSVKGTVSGGARLSWGRPSTASADLVARLEDSNLKAKIAVANLDDPAIQFDVAADRLDVDRYLPPQPVAKRADASASAGKGGTAAGPANAPTAAVDKPIDLSGLKGLNASGTVRVGALAVRRIQAQNVNLGLRAAGGRLDIAPLSATLYQGTLSGSASVNANTNQFAIREQLTGVAVGPLLRDAAGFDKLEGRGNVSVDVSTTGATVDALKRALNGNARIELHDGAVKGINLGEIVKTAGILLGSKSSLEGQGRASDQTEFAELTGSFAIRNGVAHNSDLLGRSPLLKATGRGTVDIGASRIDYLVLATPVGAIPIGGGRQLTALQGISVPVRISGPLESPRYSVDAAALAAESAKTGVKLTIEKSLGGAGAAPLIEDMLRGLRGRK